MGGRGIYYEGALHRTVQAVRITQESYLIRTKDLADKMQADTNTARRYLQLMHLEGLVYIDSWERGDPPSRLWIPWYCWQGRGMIPRKDAEKPKEKLSHR